MKRFLPLIIIASLALVPSPALGQEGHWAMPAVESLMEWNIVPDEGYEDLSRHIVSSEWNDLVSRALGLVPGDDGIEGSLRQTVARNTMLASGTEVLQRGAAFGGLMQILQVYGAVATNSDGDERVFSDWQEIPYEYRDLLSLATRDGLITGYPDGRFMPKRTITVAEALVFLHRALERYSFLEVIQIPNSMGASARETTDDGINLVIFTDRAWYGENDVVAIVAGAENRGSTPAPYTKWKVGDPAIYVWVEVGSTRLFLEEEGLSPLRLPAVTLERLPPKSLVVQRIAWDLQEWGVKPGTYAIVASFYPLRASENPANPDLIRVRLEVKVKAP